MPRRIVPADRVLALWSRGKSAREIRLIIGRVEGSYFQIASIWATLSKARASGIRVPTAEELKEKGLRGDGFSH